MIAHRPQPTALPARSWRAPGKPAWGPEAKTKEAPTRAPARSLPAPSWLRARRTVPLTRLRPDHVPKSKRHCTIPVVVCPIPCRPMAIRVRHALVLAVPSVRSMLATSPHVEFNNVAARLRRPGATKRDPPLSSCFQAHRDLLRASHNQHVRESAPGGSAIEQWPSAMSAALAIGTQRSPRADLRHD